MEPNRTEFPMLTNLLRVDAGEKAAATREYVGKGFRGLKDQDRLPNVVEGINAETLNWEKEKLIAALEAAPDDIYIDADPNQSWGNAKLVVRTMEEILQRKSMATSSSSSPFIIWILPATGTFGTH